MTNADGINDNKVFKKYINWFLKVMNIQCLFLKIRKC